MNERQKLNQFYERKMHIMFNYDETYSIHIGWMVFVCAAVNTNAKLNELNLFFRVKVSTVCFGSNENFFRSVYISIHVKPVKFMR